MIPTTLIFHTNFGDPNQMIHLLKNVSIMGGLLYVARYGAGRYSMDAGLERTEAAGTSAAVEKSRASIRQRKDAHVQPLIRVGRIAGIEIGVHYTDGGSSWRHAHR
jgi:hypothetical protein